MMGQQPNELLNQSDELIELLFPQKRLLHRGKARRLRRRAPVKKPVMLARPARHAATYFTAQARNFLLSDQLL